MDLRFVALGVVLLAGCHRGEDHPLYEWEMVIPYSPNADYPLMGAISRFNTLADCRKVRTAIIRNLEEWGPRTESPERSAATVRLLRNDTWCSLVWPDTVNFYEVPATADHPLMKMMKDTPAITRRLERWRGE